MVNEKTVFAVDIGGSKLLCGFVKSCGTIIDTEKTELQNNITPNMLEEYIVDSYKKLSARNKDVPPVACGVTIPGVADAKSGKWVYACFSGISDYPISERLRNILNLPIYIENDANANAWAEKVFGSCKDTDDFLWLTVSNGVGGGLVLGGRLYVGQCFGAGELGHLVVEDQAPLLCPCGHYGCLEAMAAGPAISKRFEMLTGEKKSAAEISELAKAGDRFAVEVIDKTAEYIGKALGKTACVLNLSKYVLGGGVMQSFELLEEKINLAFRREAFAKPNESAKIEKTALGYNAGLLGAAALAISPPNE